MARELPLDETEQELFKVGREVCPMSFGQEPSSKSESDAEQEKTQPGFQKNRRDPLDAWPGEGAPGHAQDVGATPQTVPRQCTDVAWLLAYALFTAAAGWVAVSVWPGHPMALLSLPDWRGKHCGVGANRNQRLGARDLMAMVVVPRSLLFFCRDPDDAARLQMLYPICVSQCPQGEVVACPRNLRRATTTTTTMQTTQDPGIYVPILDTRGGGLPYSPYEVESVYSAYPAQQTFAYPYYRETPHFQPILYPPATWSECLSEACS